MWGLGRLLGAAFLIAVMGTVGWRFSTHWHPSSEKYPMQGVDVSAATGTVDWGMARARDVDFAYAVATMGDTGRDPAFEGHWRAIAEQGIRRGAMHLYSLCRLAANQADHFNAIVPRDPGALPAVVAFDFSPDCTDRPAREVMLGEVKIFLERVERHTGKQVLLRVSPDFEDEYKLSQGVDRTFWATGGYLEPTYLAKGWLVWQSNAARQVDGFEHPVGWDVVKP